MCVCVCVCVCVKTVCESVCVLASLFGSALCMHLHKLMYAFLKKKKFYDWKVYTAAGQFNWRVIMPFASPQSVSSYAVLVLDSVSC